MRVNTGVRNRERDREREGLLFYICAKFLSNTSALSN
jgi:hypothetical protein